MTDTVWTLPRDLLAAFPAGGDPTVAAATWADRLLDAAGNPPEPAAWPAVLLVASPSGEPAARAVVALALARFLARRGRRAMVLDGDDQRAALTTWLGRSGREGWIDVARYGVSPAVAAVTVGDGAAAMPVLGVGSYHPVRLDAAEVPPLVERLMTTADHVVVALPASDLAAPWLALDGAGGVLCDGLRAGWDWTPPRPPLLVVRPGRKTVAPLPGRPAGRETPVAAARADTGTGGEPRGSSPVFRRLAALLAVLLVVSSAWWLLVLRQNREPVPPVVSLSPDTTALAVPGTTALPDTGETGGTRSVPGRGEAMAVPPTPGTAADSAAGLPRRVLAVAGADTTVRRRLGSGAAAPAAADTVRPDPFRLPVARDGYCLHVASLSDSLGAVAQLAEMERRYGIRGTVRRTWVKNRWWWRIYTGSFASLAAARAWSDTLKRRLDTDYAMPVSRRHLTAGR